MTHPLPVVLLLLAAAMWGLTWWPLKASNAAGIAGVPLILLTYGTAVTVIVAAPATAEVAEP